MIDILLTAEEFMDRRFEYQDEGRWSELHRGQVVHLPPEEERYGKVVMNISKYLANYFQLQKNGYACFHTGIKVSERPDTIYFPAISIFLGGKLFGETDHEIADRVPKVVFELLFSESKVRQFPQRVEKYSQLGITSVLGIDLFKDCVSDHSTGEMKKEFGRGEQMVLDKNIPGFKMPVDQIFLKEEDF
jgi:Uma2 family endonuclease